MTFFFMSLTLCCVLCCWQKETVFEVIISSVVVSQFGAFDDEIVLDWLEILKQRLNLSVLQCRYKSVFNANF